MPIKTINLSPAAFLIRDEPGAPLLWVPTVGGGGMLAANDADNANCVNSTGLANDSDSLDARDFRVLGALPVFESDARDPLLSISCYMKANDAKVAQPSIFIFDTANLPNVEQLTPYATVNAAGWYDRVCGWPTRPGVDVFASMAAGRFAVACIFSSRPTEPSYPCASFNWDAVQATLTYTHGPDTTPDPFDFQNKVGNAGAVVLSDALAIVGFTGAQAVTISGDASAQFSIAGGAFGTVGNINPGQTLQVRMTAGPAVGDVRACTVAVETRSDAWAVTTGSDVPTILNPPANRVDYIPAFQIPNTIAIPGSSIFWQPRGNTIAMPFHFVASPWPVQWATGPGGPWNDGALVGSLPINGNIYIRLRTPPGPGQVATVRLTYASTNLTSDVTITTGGEAFVHAVDLSPIDAFQDTTVTGTALYSPVASGAARHASVGSPPSRSTGASGSSVNSNLDAGRWFRLGDGSAMLFPPGAKLLGIGYGGKRTIFHTLGTVGPVSLSYYFRNPGGVFVVLPTLETAPVDQSVNILEASPGIMPPGWAADALLAAIKGDTVALARRATLSEFSGAVLYNDSYDLRLRVFFQVVKPPFGWMSEG